MLDRSRLMSKKTNEIQSVLGLMDGKQFDPQNFSSGPSDYVSWLKDNNPCSLRIEAEQFGGVTMNVAVWLPVEDSPNSAGVTTDAVRAARAALDPKLSGPLIEANAHPSKSPVHQFEDTGAREMLKRFAEPFGRYH